VPIDATNSGVDHFIPGLAVRKSTSGGAAQLGITYYFYPSGSTQLSVGFVSSTNAGNTWTTPQTLISGIPTSWLANTSQGRMVGDYISTSYGSDNLAHGVFATAARPTSGASCGSVADNCLEPMDTFGTGLRAATVPTLADPELFAGIGNTATRGDNWNVGDNNNTSQQRR
jgi:hypothetical protein